MIQVSGKFSVLALAAAMVLPASLLAQPEEKVKDKKDAEQIIITRKGDKDEKVVVEINGDKITVNGKSLDEFKDADVTVRRNKIKDVWAFADGMSGFNTFPAQSGLKRKVSVDSNRAMLGVTTEKTETGVRLQAVTRGSGAEKAGLKEGDVITKIDDTKIEDPDDLTATIRKHKPGDKVTIAYLRDKKEQKVTAELGKWKGTTNIYTTEGFNMNMDLGDLDFEHIMPRTPVVPRVMQPFGQNWSWSGGSPKLGLSVQDTEDGKGVKVIEVDDESNAEKAGVKEDDVILEADGKAVNGADEMAKVIRESKEKGSVMLKLQRAGKTQNIEVKIPRKLKTADL